MGELGNIAQQSLVRYFNVLEKTGYVNDSSVDKLILLQFLNDFLNGFQEYITDKDYALIEKLINCLTDTSCLIPFRHYKEARPVNKYYVSNQPIRVTEDITDNTIRTTEQGNLRNPEVLNNNSN